MKGLFQAVFVKRQGEMDSLNGLRAIAILMVLLHHFRDAVHVLLEHVPLRFSIFLENMYSGVDLFFVLSGFLISLGLRNEWDRSGSISFKRFYAKRTLRIFPAYYAFLLISYGLIASHYQSLFAKPLTLQVWKEMDASLDLLKAASYYFFYISNYFHRGFVHLWSLSVEEQFYVFLPLLAWGFLFRLRRRSRVLSLVLLCLLVLLFRMLAFFMGMDFEKIYTMTHFRVDSLFAGILLMEFYLIRDKFKETFLKHEMWFLFLGFLAIASYVFVERDKSSFYHTVLVYTHIYLAFSIFFILSFYPESRVAGFLSHGIFTPFARLSYTMYLWHINLAALVFGALFGAHYPNGWGLIQLVGLFVVATLLIAFFSFFLFALIEYPFLRWKDRLAESWKKGSLGA